jgi:hypothetical protein
MFNADDRFALIGIIHRHFRADALAAVVTELASASKGVVSTAGQYPERRSSLSRSLVSRQATGGHHLVRPAPFAFRMERACGLVKSPTLPPTVS